MGMRVKTRAYKATDVPICSIFGRVRDVSDVGDGRKACCGLVWRHFLSR